MKSIKSFSKFLRINIFTIISEFPTFLQISSKFNVSSYAPHAIYTDLQEQAIVVNVVRVCREWTITVLGWVLVSEKKIISIFTFFCFHYCFS